MRKIHVLGVVLGLFLSCIQTDAVVWEAEMPSLLEDCYKQLTIDLTVADIPSHAVMSHCLGSYIWENPGLRYQLNLTQHQVNYVRSVYREYQQRIHNSRRHKRQAQRAIRREIRVLSDEQRQRFFDALNEMKAEGSYDAWASIHTGIVIRSAHSGPNFLGFHRVYLTFLEFAIQRVDSSVSLSYWDSTMDNDMVNPRETALFTSQLLGNGIGEVRDGPFAGWLASDNTVLNRNIGSGASLMTKTAISRFLEGTAATSHRQIVVGFGQNLLNTLEGQHNNVHNWVGGDMADGSTTAYDPVFFLHHTFIDYIWERFRQKVRQQGTDPTTDYPWPMTFSFGDRNQLHDPRRPMDNYENFTNIDGYSDIFTQEFYQYEDMPSCPCGNSRFLRCEGGVCIAASASDIGEESSAQIMGRTAFIGGGADEQRVINSPFQTSMIDPRTQNANGNRMNGAAPNGRGPAGFSPFQSSMIDPRVGNIRNGAIPPRGAPAGSLQGMLGFHRGVNNGRFNSGSPVANFRNSAAPGFGVMGGRNVGFQGLSGAGGVIQHASAAQSGLLGRLGIRGQSGNPLQRFPPSPINPVRHLWDPRIGHVGSQRTNLIQYSPEHNSPLSLDDIRRLTHVTDLPIQNTFTINRVSDTRLWVFMPIRIIYMRPPGYFFGSRTVRNSRIMQNVDMYSPQMYSEFNDISPKVAPATYPNCYKSLGGSSKVYVQSTGFSYCGKYLEYAVVDERQPVSEAIAYVAVKNPDLGAAKAYLTAFDSCGRVCQPRCLIPGSSPPSYQPCSGVINLSNRLPRMYGRTYGEAVRSRWNFGDKNCPSSYGGEIFMTFYCDYENVWPWKSCNGGTRKGPVYFGK
ncbi:uncharacterized protein LOC125668782 [Ostrea edulis]|uniref:uncharacterized protein LOC125668782 n=1 Tax=Ostrea edulis TaxID=37623 RepID=UPI0024AF62F7|nr:uncharacterized protein LOC125668782 [Ostrea edulis]